MCRARPVKEGVVERTDRSGAGGAPAAAAVRNGVVSRC